MASRRAPRAASTLPGEDFGAIQPVNAPPPRYTKELAVHVRAACNAGYTLTELCRLIGISFDTLNLWQIIYPAFAEALKSRHLARSERVENALYQRAVGYEQPGERLFYDKERGVVRATTLTHIPADPVAARSWLEVHKPEVYRRKEPEGEGNRLVVEIVGHPGPLEMHAKDDEDSSPGVAFGAEGGLPETP